MNLDEFKYFGSQVKFKLAITDEGYALLKYINGKLVAKEVFKDKITAKCAKFKHEIARELGAKFNSKGYWAMETIPVKNRLRAREIMNNKF